MNSIISTLFNEYYVGAHNSEKYKKIIFEINKVLCDNCGFDEANKLATSLINATYIERSNTYKAGFKAGVNLMVELQKEIIPCSPDQS